jgi:HPr kinase/phosphorylase
MVKFVSLEELIEHFQLERLNGASIEDKKVTSPELNRIGLQLTGFLDGFAFERIQIVGMVEYKYIEQLSEERQREVVAAVMQHDIPCIIFSRNLPVPALFVELGDKYNVPILATPRITTNFVADLLKYIDLQLAERTTIHGVLVDINGVGTLILGKSGVGKSETALELVKRGHRFVADDAIDITKIGDQTLEGKSPELIKNFMEIRGIGIVDMSKLYGIGSVRESIILDLIVQIEEWSNESDYDRLGLDEKYMTILGVDVAMIKLPVKPGRNLAVILEAAARNHSLKRMGFNAAVELDTKLRALHQG